MVKEGAGLSESEIFGQTNREAIRAGDPEIWGMIYEKYHDPLQKYCTRFDPELAEDLTNDVFIEAIRSCTTWGDTGKTHLKGWLYKIAHSRCISHMRRNRPFVPFDELTHAWDEDPFEEIHKTDELVNLAHDVQSLVTPAQYEILRLRFLEGQSHEQIAHMTGRSELAVKSLQHRGLISARRKLTKYID